MKIAVIGAGISGMSCAHLLSQQHEVTLLEAQNTLGGHTATKKVKLGNKDHNIDTGFIVFNDRTYPLFNKLLLKLGIARQPTEMSFSVVNQQENLQYNGHSLSSLFAQRKNLFNVKFYRLLAEIMRFNREAKKHAKSVQTLGEFLDERAYSEYFQNNYLLPMGAAIWSTSLAHIREFSLAFFVRFFVNHGLLDIRNRPQWYVIPNGSQNYIAPLIAPFKDNIKYNARVVAVDSHAEHIALRCEDGWQWQGDAVVFACHSDQALSILGEQATEHEKEVLGALPYQDNEVILHCDTRFLPSEQRAQASWNYLLPQGEGSAQQLASVTYDMNRLQGLSDDVPQVCVSLNPRFEVDESKVLGRYVYAHPQFSQQAEQAKQQRAKINGQARRYYCGAYWYNGFHEDGVRSAVDVASHFGCSL